MMEELGYIRCLDDLGRIVIPKQLREKIGVKEGSQMVMYIDGDGLKIEKNKVKHDIANEEKNDLDEANRAAVRECLKTISKRLKEFTEEYGED